MFILYSCCLQKVFCLQNSLSLQAIIFENTVFDETFAKYYQKSFISTLNVNLAAVVFS